MQHLAEVIDRCINRLEEATAEIPDCLLPDALNEGVKRLRKARDMIAKKPHRNWGSANAETVLENLKKLGSLLKDDEYEKLLNDLKRQ
jgi:hypothetical protein